jgi:hypothetical protein
MTKMRLPGIGQHVDRGAHRIRIGVVAVVDDQRALAPGATLQAALDPGKGLQALLHRRRRGTPAASVAAAAAQALRALWTPGTCEPDLERCPRESSCRSPPRPCPKLPRTSAGLVEAEAQTCGNRATARARCPPADRRH